MVGRKGKSRQVGQYWKLGVRWREALVQITAPTERFPQLRDVRVDMRLRVFDAWLRDLRHRPQALVTDHTEIFLVG